MKPADITPGAPRPVCLVDETATTTAVVTRLLEPEIRTVLLIEHLSKSLSPFVAIFCGNGPVLALVEQPM